MPCIGEQLKDREANKTDEVCFNQMKAIAGTVGYFNILSNQADQVLVCIKYCLLLCEHCVYTG